MSKSADSKSLLLKEKVRDLEAEVSKLKQRLEDLRKAKNNTILKREREVVQVGGPNLGRAVGVDTAKHKGLELKFKQSEERANQLENKVQSLNEELKNLLKDQELLKMRLEKQEQEMAEMKDAHLLEVTKITAESNDNRARADDVSNNLERLQEKLEFKSMQEETEKLSNNEREVYIAELINENTQLREKVEKLLNELSEKEVHWLQNKDMLSQKIQEKWDMKYVKWMSDTEKKIEELRAANLVLKQCLSKRNDISPPTSPHTSKKPSTSKPSHSTSPDYSL